MAITLSRAARQKVGGRWMIGRPRAAPAVAAIVTAGLAARLVSAVPPLAAQAPLPPIHPLGAVVGQIDSLGGVRGIHVLSDGRVVVNEIGLRRIVIYDPSLAHVQRVIDTTFNAKMFAYLADTSLFLNLGTHELVVMDPAGVIGRAISLPGPAGLTGNTTPFTNRPDARGRIVYQGGGLLRPLGGVQAGDARADSIVLTRLDLTRGVIDTITAVAVFRIALGADVLTELFGGASAALASAAIGAGGFVVVNTGVIYGSSVTGSSVVFGSGATAGDATGGGARGGGGGAGAEHAAGPAVFTKSLAAVAHDAGLSFAPPSDGWAVLSDGTIAVARGQEHVIDLYATDGSHTVSPPFSGRGPRYTAEAKTAFVDSLKRTYAANPGPTARPPAISADEKVLLSAPTFPDAATLPDYAGTFAQVKADAEDNLWLQEVADPTVWDVVNRSGHVTDRVRVPASMTIEWFGPGVVYLTSIVGPTLSLVKARVR